jgi:hypothetical protein
LSASKFTVTDEEGIWFARRWPTCGIGEDGVTAARRSADPGENEVAWFPAIRFPRLPREPRFASSTGQSIIHGRTYVEYRGSRCGVTMDSAIYCVHGDDPNSQIMVTTGMTLRGPDAAPGN